jgi:peroxiredoxin
VTAKVAIVLTIIHLACALSDSARAQEPQPTTNKRFEQFELVNIAGKTITRDDWRESKLVLLFFIATECPVSNGYAPLMERIAARCAREGARCYGVHCDPAVTAQAAAKHANEYGLSFTILLDPAQTLARAAGVRVTPEAVVATPEGKVLYRGRIDNRFTLDGKRRDEPTVRDLEDALDAVLSGAQPAVSETKAFGCPLPRAKAGSLVN